MLAAPLREDGTVVAALVLASGRPDALDDAALDLVNAAGAQALGAILRASASGGSGPTVAERGHRP